MITRWMFTISGFVVFVAEKNFGKLFVEKVSEKLFVRKNFHLLYFKSLCFTGNAYSDATNLAHMILMLSTFPNCDKFPFLSVFSPYVIPVFHIPKFFEGCFSDIFGLMLSVPFRLIFEFFLFCAQ